MLNIDNCLKDNSVRSIMKSVGNKYRYFLDEDDISSISLTTLWRCTQKYDPDRKAKFTSYLYQQLNYAFKNQLKKNSKKRDYATEDIEKVYHDYSGSEAFDILNSIPPESAEILRQRYYGNMTIQEIGEANGYSRETARRRINQAIDECNNN
jgi:RNA polymerase sigma factor (sigma-70 family)